MLTHEKLMQNFFHYLIMYLYNTELDIAIKSIYVQK